MEKLRLGGVDVLAYGPFGPPFRSDEEMISLTRKLRSAKYDFGDLPVLHRSTVIIARRVVTQHRGMSKKLTEGLGLTVKNKNKLTTSRSHNLAKVGSSKSRACVKSIKALSGFKLRFKKSTHACSKAGTAYFLAK
uniref:Uncharacterized protein n=1 Tax=Romanomermis culicivorax TaxID=13658 RepID=A0A915JDQ1_ROMCU